MNTLKTLTALGLVCLMATGIANAQQSPAPAKLVIVPVKVDVVISRFQGDKKISSLPFTLWVNTGSRQSLRVGVDVPVGAVTSTNTNSNSNQTSSTATTSTRPEYHNVGTSIDCWLNQKTADEPGFMVNVSIQDSSIYSTDADGRSAMKIPDLLAFRTFTMSNALMIRDGQTVQFTTATDKISGEVMKVDVTATSVK